MRRDDLEPEEWTDADDMDLSTLQEEDRLRLNYPVYHKSGSVETSHGSIRTYHVEEVVVVLMIRDREAYPDRNSGENVWLADPVDDETREEWTEQGRAPMVLDLSEDPFAPPKAGVEAVRRVE